MADTQEGLSIKFIAADGTKYRVSEPKIETFLSKFPDAKLLDNDNVDLFNGWLQGKRAQQEIYSGVKYPESKPQLGRPQVSTEENPISADDDGRYHAPHPMAGKKIGYIDAKPKYEQTEDKPFPMFDQEDKERASNSEHLTQAEYKRKQDLLKEEIKNHPWENNPGIQPSAFGVAPAADNDQINSNVIQGLKGGSKQFASSLLEGIDKVVGYGKSAMVPGYGIVEDATKRAYSAISEDETVPVEVRKHFNSLATKPNTVLGDWANSLNKSGAEDFTQAPQPGMAEAFSILPQMLPIVAAMSIPGAQGAVLPMFGLIGGGSSTQQYKTYLENSIKEGNPSTGYDPMVDLGLFVAGAAIEAGTEKLGSLANFVHGKYFTKAAKTLIAKEILSTSGEQGPKAIFQKFASQNPSLAKEIWGKWIKNPAEETAEEISASLLSYGTSAALYDKDANWKTLGEQTAQAALGGFVMGGLLTGYGHALTSSRIKKAREANQQLYYGVKPDGTVIEILGKTEQGYTVLGKNGEIDQAKKADISNIVNLSAEEAELLQASYKAGEMVTEELAQPQSVPTAPSLTQDEYDVALPVLNDLDKMAHRDTQGNPTGRVEKVTDGDGNEYYVRSGDVQNPEPTNPVTLFSPATGETFVAQDGLIDKHEVVTEDFDSFRQNAIDTKLAEYRQQQQPQQPQASAAQFDGKIWTPGAATYEGKPITIIGQDQRGRVQFTEEGSPKVSTTNYNDEDLGMVDVNTAEAAPAPAQPDTRKVSKVKVGNFNHDIAINEDGTLDVLYDFKNEETAKKTAEKLSAQIKNMAFSPVTTGGEEYVDENGLARVNPTNTRLIGTPIAQTQQQTEPQATDTQVLPPQIQETTQPTEPIQPQVQELKIGKSTYRFTENEDGTDSYEVKSQKEVDELNKFLVPKGFKAYPIVETITIPPATKYDQPVTKTVITSALVKKITTGLPMESVQLPGDKRKADIEAQIAEENRKKAIREEAEKEAKKGEGKETIVADQEKKRRTFWQPSKEAKQRASTDPLTPQEAVLQYFVMGGQISTEDFIRLTGWGKNPDDPHGKTELEAYRWLHGKMGIPVDQLSLATDTPMMEYYVEREGANAIQQLVADAIHAHGDRKSMLTALARLQDTNGMSEQEMEAWEQNSLYQDQLEWQEAEELHNEILANLVDTYGEPPYDLFNFDENITNENTQGSNEGISGQPSTGTDGNTGNDPTGSIEGDKGNIEGGSAEGEPDTGNDKQTEIDKQGDGGAELTPERFHNLEPAQTFEQFEANLSEILKQYSGREMASIQAESYLNSYKDTFGKQYLDTYGIKSRDEFKVFVAKLQTDLRKGKGKGRSEALKQIQDEKANNAVSEIEKMALEAEAEMQAQIKASEETAKPLEIGSQTIYNNQPVTIVSRTQDVDSGKWTYDVELADGSAIEDVDLNTISDQVAVAASETNTSPTEGQKEAGNYKKGVVNFQGMEIAIENPIGSTRSGKDEDGKTWENVMKSHYGYFKRTKGKDGDQIDTFIGEDLSSPIVYVIDQNNPSTGEFDESKVMLGFLSPEQAKEAYLSNYDKDWKGFGSITPINIEDFKIWLKDGKRQNKAFSEYKNTPDPITLSNSETDGKRLSSFKKGDIVYRNYNGRHEEYEVIDDKKDIWKLRNIENGGITDWNAHNSPGFILKEQVSSEPNKPVFAGEFLNKGKDATHEDFGEKIGGAKKDLGITRTVRDTDSLPAWRRKYSFTVPGVMEIGKKVDTTKPFAVNYFEKTRFGDREYFVTEIKDGYTTRTPKIFTSEEEAEAYIPIFEVAKQGFRVHKKSDTEFQIYKKASTGKALEFDTFPTQEETQVYLNSTEGATSLLNRKREDFSIPALEKVERTGKDWRKGKDVTTEEFKDKFGFRGGEFGNWVKPEERKVLLNTAYDSLMDLAEILNIPPRAISLNGNLSIAFGARGASSASAHYESLRAVINLTRLNGAGSLAHEWAHALDNYFGLQSSNKNYDRDEKGELKAGRDYRSEGAIFKSGMRKELADIFDEIVNATQSKSVTKQMSVEEKQSYFDKFQKHTRTEADTLIKRLTEGTTTYQYNRKTKTREDVKKQATPEQLQSAKEITDRIVNGESEPLKWQSITGNRLGEYSYINPDMRALSEIYKSVFRGNGLARNSYGFYNLGYYANKLYGAKDVLEKAKAGESETQSISTDYLKASKKFDKSRVEPYWQKKVEMFARAFETFINNKLGVQRSDYLQYDKSPVYKALFNDTPYLDGEEATQLNKLFEKFFNELQTKTDGNNVSLQEPTPVYNGKEYKTQEGETIRYTTSESNNNGQYGLWEQDNTAPATDTGEFTSVERQISEQKHIVLSGNVKIKSPEDVAYLFRHLESAVSENAFAVFIDKSGKYKVLYLSTGTTIGTIVDIKLVATAAKEFNAVSVTFVHNHPSGNLTQSPADDNIHGRMRNALDGICKVNPGIIINLDSGKYAEFGYNEHEVKNTIQSVAKETKVKVYAFDRQVLYSPSAERAKITNSRSVAEFLSKIKRGTVDKFTILILNRQYKIVRAFLDDNISAEHLLPIIGKHGETVIISGNRELRPGYLNNIKRQLKAGDTDLLDYVQVEQDKDIMSAYKSYTDEGNIYEPEINYDSKSVNEDNSILAHSQPQSLENLTFDQRNKAVKAEAQAIMEAKGITHDLFVGISVQSVVSHYKKLGASKGYLKAIEESLSNTMINGFFDPIYKKIVVLANRVTDMAKLEGTIVHEAAHATSRAIFKNRRREVMQFVADAIGVEEMDRRLAPSYANEAEYNKADECVAYGVQKMVIENTPPTLPPFTYNEIIDIVDGRTPKPPNFVQRFINTIYHESAHAIHAKPSRTVPNNNGNGRTVGTDKSLTGEKPQNDPLRSGNVGKPKGKDGGGIGDLFAGSFLNKQVRDEYDNRSGNTEPRTVSYSNERGQAGTVQPTDKTGQNTKPSVEGTTGRPGDIAFSAHPFAGSFLNDPPTPFNNNPTTPKEMRAMGKKLVTGLDIFLEHADQDIALKNLQEEVSKLGGEVLPNHDAYNIITTISSRNAQQVKEFNEDFFQPLEKAVVALMRDGSKEWEVKRYMKAKRSIEREDVDKKPSTSPDPNHPWSRKNVEGYVSDFEANHSLMDIKRLWKANKMAQNRIVDIAEEGGRINARYAEDMRNASKYYVPLRGWTYGNPETEDPTKVFDYENEEPVYQELSKEAVGRGSESGDPLAYTAMLATSAIHSANRNQLKMRVLNMWKHNKGLQGLESLVSVKKTYEEQLEDGTWVEREGEAPKRKLDNGTARLYPDNVGNKKRLTQQQASENELAVYEKGRKVVLVFPDPIMKRVLMGRNQVGQELLDNKAVGVARDLVQLWKKFTTSWNPSFFLVYNPTKDLMGALPSYWVNGGSAVELLKDISIADKHLARMFFEKGTGTALDQLTQLWADGGGMTMYANMDDVNAASKKISKELSKLNDKISFEELLSGNPDGNLMDMLAGGKNAAGKTIKQYLEFAAMWGENRTRAGVFLAEIAKNTKYDKTKGTTLWEQAIAEIKAGRNIDAEVLLSKEISGNFNRKGKSAGLMGLWYAFWNPPIQSAYKHYNMLKKNPKRFAAMMAAVAGMGFLWQAMLNALLGDDEYNKLGWRKYSTISFPIGDHTFSLPMGFVWNLPWSLGAGAYNVAKGFMTPEKYAKEALSNLIQTATPVTTKVAQDGSMDLVRPFVPTLGTLPYDLSTNTDWAGNSVYRDNIYNKFTPQSELGKTNVSPILESMAQGLNRIGGGNKIKSSGYLTDWNPSKVQHALEFAFSGTGKFSLQMAGLVKKPWNELSASEIPIASRFISNRKEQSVYPEYKQLKDKIDEYQSTLKGYDKNGMGEEFHKFKNHDMDKVSRKYNDIDKKVKEYWERYNAETDPDKKKELNDKQQERMKQLLDYAKNIKNK